MNFTFSEAVSRDMELATAREELRVLMQAEKEIDEAQAEGHTARENHAYRKAGRARVRLRISLKLLGAIGPEDDAFQAAAGINHLFEVCEREARDRAANYAREASLVN